MSESRIASELGRKHFLGVTSGGHSCFSAGSATLCRRFGGLHTHRELRQRNPEPNAFEVMLESLELASHRLHNLQPSVWLSFRKLHLWSQFGEFFGFISKGSNKPMEGWAVTNEGCAAGAVGTPGCTTAGCLSVDSFPKNLVCFLLLPADSVIPETEIKFKINKWKKKKRKSYSLCSLLWATQPGCDGIPLTHQADFAGPSRVPDAPLSIALPSRYTAVEKIVVGGETNDQNRGVKHRFSAAGSCTESGLMWYLRGAALRDAGLSSPACVVGARGETIPGYPSWWSGGSYRFLTIGRRTH